MAVSTSEANDAFKIFDEFIHVESPGPTDLSVSSAAQTSLHDITITNPGTNSHLDDDQQTVDSDSSFFVRCDRVTRGLGPNSLVITYT